MLWWWSHDACFIAWTKIYIIFLICMFLCNYQWMHPSGNVSLLEGHADWYSRYLLLFTQCSPLNSEPNGQEDIFWKRASRYGYWIANLSLRLLKLNVHGWTASRALCKNGWKIQLLWERSNILLPGMPGCSCLGWGIMHFNVVSSCKTFFNPRCCSLTVKSLTRIVDVY